MQCICRSHWQPASDAADGDWWNWSGQHGPSLDYMLLTHIWFYILCKTAVFKDKGGTYPGILDLWTWSQADKYQYIYHFWERTITFWKGFPLHFCFIWGVRASLHRHSDLYSERDQGGLCSYGSSEPYITLLNTYFHYHSNCTPPLDHCYPAMLPHFLTATFHPNTIIYLSTIFPMQIRRTTDIIS